MIVRLCLPGLLACCILWLFPGCTEKQDSKPTEFTKADSLTETYLSLQDSMLQAWNVMINDDNQKIEAMHNLLHELQVSGATSDEPLELYEERIHKLKKLRYSRKSMANEDVVAEYDFASNAIVTDLVALAETQRQFAYNTTLQKLVETIRTSEARVEQYRQAYDQITLQYNNFVNENRRFLSENASDSITMRPLFQMASE